MVGASLLITNNIHKNGRLNILLTRLKGVSAYCFKKTMKKSKQNYEGVLIPLPNTCGQIVVKPVLKFALLKRG